MFDKLYICFKLFRFLVSKLFVGVYLELSCAGAAIAPMGEAEHLNAF